MLVLPVVAALGLASCATPSGNARVDAAEASGDGVLRIGMILDNLDKGAFLNASQLAGAKLAVQEINVAGGHKGRPVELLPESISQDTAEQARALVSAHADVVVGPTDSSRAPAAIDVLTRSRTVLISPGNSAAGLSSYNSGGYYFRTAAADVAQGGALAKLAVDGGAKRIALLHEAGGYGEEVAASAASAVIATGAETVANEEFKAGDAAGAVARVKEATPDAIILVARGGAQGALAELGNAQVPGAKLVLSDGAVRQYGSGLASKTLDGARGILPGVFPSAHFQGELVAVDATLKDMTFAAEAYDAVNLAAIAAAAAEDDAGSSIAAWLTAVSGGVRGRATMEGVAGNENRSRESSACGSYKECLTIVAAGRIPDYQGQSGPITFDANGDISSANYMVFMYGADNRAKLVGSQNVAKSG